MTRRYYSSRNNPRSLTVAELYLKLQYLYTMFQKRNYFKHKADITNDYFSDSIKYKAGILLTFQPFPINKWLQSDITEDHIFDAIEFLYDHVSKPGELVQMTSDTGYNYQDYDGYDEDAGRVEFRETANVFLADYKEGYELVEGGSIQALGSHGLQYILDADIVTYDKVNVDNKVRDAINKWRNRHLSISEKKEAIRELADVFEWLKKTKNLSNVFNKKDDAAIFEIANKFDFRHHNLEQKTDYDRAIWYSWIFHFYLATYHAAVRSLIKYEKNKGG